MAKYFQHGFILKTIFNQPTNRLVVFSVIRSSCAAVVITPCASSIRAPPETVLARTTTATSTPCSSREHTCTATLFASNSATPAKQSPSYNGMQSLQMSVHFQRPSPMTPPRRKATIPIHCRCLPGSSGKQIGVAGFDSICKTEGQSSEQRAMDWRSSPLCCA